MTHLGVLWAFFSFFFFPLSLPVSTATRDAQLWVMFCSKSLIPLAALRLPTRLRLSVSLSHFGRQVAPLAMKIRQWLAPGSIGSHMCPEHISVVSSVLLLALYFYEAFWVEPIIPPLFRVRAADDSTVVEDSMALPHTKVE